MTLADAFAPAEAEYRAQVEADTWGHLAPKSRKVYKGFILFAYGEYGDLMPIKVNFEDLPDSPWFFDDMLDFLWKFSDKPKGEVYRFDGTYTKLKNGKGRFVGKTQRVIF
jgi:hypothetical protein